jgi:hypothetical protein
MFNATFNNISVISRQSVLLVEETGENHRPVASHWQTLSHNVVHLVLIEIRTHNISRDRHWLQYDHGQDGTSYYSIYFLCIIYLQAISTLHFVSCEVRHSCPAKILWEDVSSLFCPNNTNYYHCLQIKDEETYENICKRPARVTPGIYILQRSSCLWSYGSWIYNHLCNQCPSPLMWVWISIRVRCTTLFDKVFQWLTTGRWFSPGPPVSSTNKTDRHDITEILLR